MPDCHCRTLATSFILALTLACSGGAGDDANDAAADADTGVATEQPAATAAADVPAEASMTPEDIDRWQRGMEAELAAVEQAGEQLRNAKSNDDSLSAMMASNETSTRAAGARGAGVDEQRYGIIRSAMSSVVRYMAPLQAEMDVSQMPAEMRAAMQANRDSSLARMVPSYSPAVIEALRPRAEALRRQEMALVGARLKAAGMAR